MKLGILISMFPEAHETFILRELAELERRGVAFRIFSLQLPRDDLDDPDARRLAARTHYGRLWGARAWGGLAATLLTRPLRLGGAVVRLVHAYARQPVELLKSLAILPLALRYGRLARRAGIRHLHGHWANIPTTACWVLSMIYEDMTWSAAIHGENIFTKNPGLRRKLKDARFLVVCNGYSLRHLRERMDLPRPEDVHLNYHGLSPQVWEAAAAATPPDGAGSAAEGPFRILSIGRLVGFKGHDDLVRAVGRLAAEGRDVRLRIVGTGPGREELAALAEAVAPGRVTFPGRLPFETVLEELPRSDAFALASRYAPDGWFDGIPNVLAEAMAFGRPVVSTRVSGIPELVEEERSGLLVEERDPDALAAALARIADDPDLARRLGRNAARRVREVFDLGRNVDELVGLFRRYLPEEDGRA
jgi:glycosyltransferase involved in cell wall biosynthesis